MTDFWRFNDGHLEGFEMPEWLESLLQDDIDKGLREGGYTPSMILGDKDAWGVELFDAEDRDKMEFPYLAIIQDASSWQLVGIPSFVDYMEFLHFVSPMLISSMLSWVFDDDHDIRWFLEKLHSEHGPIKR